jgi:hypothetical protein
LWVLAADALDCLGVDGTVDHQLRQRQLGGVGAAGGGGGPERGVDEGGDGERDAATEEDGGAPLLRSRFAPTYRRGARAGLELWCECLDHFRLWPSCARPSAPPSPACRIMFYSAAAHPK